MTLPPDAPEPSDDVDDPTGAGVRAVMGVLPTLARVGWFSFGALVATSLTLAVVVHPWSKPAASGEAPMPYEIFPFADNAGVCQEWVALAGVETSHEDAMATVRRLSGALPTAIRAENFRVVRAFTPNDRWTIAVDAQPGAGDEAGARRVADAMNAVPGTGIHFEPVYYSSRRLYDSARVLCMPRQTASNGH